VFPEYIIIKETFMHGFDKNYRKTGLLNNWDSFPPLQCPSLHSENGISFWLVLVSRFRFETDFGDLRYLLTNACSQSGIHFYYLFWYWLFSFLKHLSFLITGHMIWDG